jgi:LPXTG-motif cell wall-anchored protein
MKKNKVWFIIGGAVVLIAGLGFILLRKPKEKEEEGGSVIEVDPTAQKPETSTQLSFELVGFAQKPGVTTISVRTSPNLISSTKKNLESFITVYARPSNVKGWSEVSEDNETVLGYVPNEVLRKL